MRSIVIEDCGLETTLASERLLNLSDCISPWDKNERGIRAPNWLSNSRDRTPGEESGKFIALNSRPLYCS